MANGIYSDFHLPAVFNIMRHIFTENLQISQQVFSVNRQVENVRSRLNVLVSV